MSDTSQGDNWWQASDGKWYPPTQQPDTTAAAASVPAEPDPTMAIPTTPADDATAPDGAVSGMSAAPPTPPTPPVAPPTGAGDATGGSGSGGRGKIIGGIAAVIVLVIAAFAVLSLTSDDEASAGEVVLESVGTAGTDPFTAPVAAVDARVSSFADNGPPAEVAPVTSSGPAGYQSADGSVPGLFGGSLSESSCDVDQLVAFLDAEPEKAAVWAGTIEIDVDDVSSFIDGLTPTNLAADTRLVNNAFVDGEVAPRDVVLQRGAAVLADEAGVPRVNCYSGNPLTKASAVEDEPTTGDEWPAFQQTNVIIINQAPTPLTEFELVEISTGELFSRPTGSTGAEDVAQEPIVDPAEQDVADDGPIEFDTLITDRLEDGRKEARFTLDAPDGGILSISVDNERSSVSQLRFKLTSAGTTYFDEFAAPGENLEGTAIFSHDSGAPLEAVITGGPAAYSFTIGLEIQDDAGIGADAGDDLASSALVEAGDYAGLVGGDDKGDFYEIELDPGSDLVVSLANDRTSEAQVRLRATIDGGAVFDEFVQPGSDDQSFTLLSGVIDEAVQIEVTGGTATYQFSVTFLAQTDSDAEGGDAGDDIGSATVLTDLGDISGAVGQLDPADMWVFDPSTATTISFTNAATSSAQIRVKLINQSGSSVADFFVKEGVSASETIVSVPGETYRLEVTGGRATYTGSLS